MLAAAGRIAGAVEVPVTVDAEAGYGIEPADLVAALKKIGAAGCNLEDTNHATGELRDPVEHAAWLRAVREAASDQGYGLVINTRIDVFLAAAASESDGGSQGDLGDEALRRAHAYAEAGADCVFPIILWERDALAAFISEAPGPVNVLRIPPAPSEAELAELGWRESATEACCTTTRWSSSAACSDPSLPLRPRSRARRPSVASASESEVSLPRNASVSKARPHAPESDDRQASCGTALSLAQIAHCDSEPTLGNRARCSSSSGVWVSLR